jgi:hypothetical protein
MRTRDQAREQKLRGWNLRCSFCGDYGATWTRTCSGNEYCFCAAHRKEFDDENHRYAVAIERLKTIHYRQDPQTYHGPREWD